jgi:zinc protease
MTYASFIKEKRLSWGGKVQAARFPAHGAVSIVGSVAGGARLAGSGMAADLHAEMLLEGTQTYAKKDIQILLDSIGASLSFSVEGERLVFAGRVAAASAETLLALIVDALSHPTFPKKESEALKARAEADLALEEKDTNEQAQTALSRMLFYKNHPNWEETTEEAREVLKKITPSALRQYHKRAIDKKTLVVSIVGDMSPAQAIQLVNKYFASLPAAHSLLPSVVAAQPTLPTQEVVPIKDKASIHYLLGIPLGITKEHADYPALVLAANILGNRRGFSGRLMKTVREEQGLTYGIYSYLSGITHFVDGLFVVWATFAPELFAKGRAATFEQVRLFVQKGVTAAEAKKHREMFAKSFVVQLSNSGALARASHDVVVDGKSVAYLDQFPKKILKITPKEVHAAVRKYILLDKLSESAAGPLESI